MQVCVDVCQMVPLNTALAWAVLMEMNQLCIATARPRARRDRRRISMLFLSHVRHPTREPLDTDGMFPRSQCG